MLRKCDTLTGASGSQLLENLNEILREQNVKASFRKVVASFIVDESDIDLTDISKRDVLRLTKAYLNEHGFKASEVLEKVREKEDDPTPKNTSGLTRLPALRGTMGLRP